MVKLGPHDYVQTLKGKALRFPNLDVPMKDWPKGMSSHYEDLRVVQEIELKKLVGEGKAYSTCVSTDCPFLVSTWFPKASWDRLRLLTHVIIFLYLWDDAIDNPELTDLFNNLDASNTFREETRKQVDRYLADVRILGDATDSHNSPTLRSFVPIGEAFAFRMTKGQRVQILDELHKYLDAFEWTAPTIKEYLHCRMGTSAVGFVVACLEYITGIDLGDTIRNDEYVKVVFNETVCNVGNGVSRLVTSLIVNDILSLRRELRYPYYNNAVAVLYHQLQDLQMAVDETYKIILRNMEKLEEAAKWALGRYPERRENLAAWIDGCKNMCTGNVTWSLHIARYALGVNALDGTTEITL
ncbi:isoprenoid synthase domain-containing protein [Mycena leptocephala]|nr:isoprenoid synthase domain-containing protein [Mycena leptocephala]